MVYPGSAYFQRAQTKHRVREVCKGGAGTYWTDIASRLVFGSSVSLLKCTGRRILFARRIAQIWYTRIGNAEGTVQQSTRFTKTHLCAFTEKTLVTLRKRQREKIEEIKKKTNYYTTRNLLDRYDESVSGPGTPPQRRQPIPQTPVQRQPNQKQGQAKSQKNPTPSTLQTPFERAFLSLSPIRQVNIPQQCRLRRSLHQGNSGMTN